jgi:hypothetical protein
MCAIKYLLYRKAGKRQTATEVFLSNCYQEPQGASEMCFKELVISEKKENI